MNETWTSLVLVMLLVLVGGLFAAAEIALVSLRESQIRALSQRGRRGSRIARLAADPNRFLAAVQIGVTLAGFLSAAVGAATLSDDLAPVLEAWGLDAPAAETMALILITVLVAYLSLVFGELAPKRLALQRSEQVSYALGPPLDVLATLFRPVIWFLSVSSDLAVRLFGGDPSLGRGQITPEELREMVSGHEQLGEEERRIVGDVFDAGDRQIREVMVPRTEVEFLDADQPVRTAATEAMQQPHSRYPVIDGSVDDVVGFVHIRDLLDPTLAGRSVRVGALARQVVFLPDTKQLLSALTEMRRAGAHLAIVVDEYGGTDGIVTMEDLVEELIGDFRDEYDAPGADDRAPSLGEVDGLLNLDEFAEQTGVDLPDGPYETVAGFVIAQLGRLPLVGESVDVEGHRLHVRALDGRRVARVHVSALTSQTGDEAESPGPAGALGSEQSAASGDTPVPGASGST